MSAPIVERKFPVDPAQLLPAITPDNEPFWSALAQGRLQLQACGGCGKARHPIAPVCPYCRGTHWAWRELSGAGTIFSFVRYHRSYLPEFEDVMPYVVATVQLEQGPRMFGRLIGRDVAPRMGQAVRLVVERWPDGRCVAAFELVDTDETKGKS
jgi:uncharacterized protein